jgi:UDP-galactopyranose mutase
MVWDFVCRFTEWTSFRHYVKATGGDVRVYSVPFSGQTLYEIYGEDFLAKWEADKISAEGGEGDSIASFARQEIGKEVFQRLIRDYTEKQWGRSCEELPGAIIRRLPIRPSWRTDWFGDSFQGMPTEGYTALFQKMLGNTRVQTGVDYTRQLQWSHFYHEEGGGTVTRECSVDYRETGDPYYPLKDAANAGLAQDYLERVPEGFTFGGRLATYQYYDMHQVIAQGMHHAEEWLQAGK